MDAKLRSKKVKDVVAKTVWDIRRDAPEHKHARRGRCRDMVKQAALAQSLKKWLVNTRY
ncbi:MAG: hypothetical protein GY761_10210 [Hyphomicrobiales bacterium]|nr:hypothetical protein [Hyphomicrobiales bacterium]